MSDKIRSEAASFMVALGERVEELKAGTIVPDPSESEIDFKTYQRFREVMSECLSFLIIIERRIEELPEDEHRASLREQFDEHSAALWSGLLEISLKYLGAICQRDQLPLGTRYVFTQELKTLHDADRALLSKTIAPHLDEQTEAYREKASQILNEIIDNAPQLLKVTP